MNFLLELLVIPFYVSGFLLIAMIGLFIVITPTIVIAYYLYQFIRNSLIKRGFDVISWEKKNEQREKDHPYEWLIIPIVFLIIGLLSR